MRPSTQWRAPWLAARQLGAGNSESQDNTCENQWGSHTMMAQTSRQPTLVIQAGLCPCCTLLQARTCTQDLRSTPVTLPIASTARWEGSQRLRFFACRDLVQSLPLQCSCLEVLAPLLLPDGTGRVVPCEAVLHVHCIVPSRARSLAKARGQPYSNDNLLTLCDLHSRTR